MSKQTYPRVVELLNEHIPVKISRNEFCRVTGVNRNSVDRYRAGVGCPTTETLERLSKYFGVSVVWLRGESDDGPVSPEAINSSAEKLITELNEIAAIHEITPEELRGTFRLMFVYWQSKSEKIFDWLVIGNLAAEKVQEIEDLWSKVDRAVYYDLKA
jgi:Predicted transcriptional regulator